MFKSHTNLYAIKIDSNCVSVGIGLSHFSSDYVNLGLPNAKLIAEKMNLTFHYLPISHKQWKKLFNDFYRTHPTANDANRKKLAKLFLEKSNCTTIFP